MILSASCSSPVVLINKELRVADELHNNFRYEEAINHYLNYLNNSSKLGIYRNMNVEAEACRKLAGDFAMLSKFSKAREFLFMAVQIDSSTNNNLKLIEDYREFGKVEYYAGNYRKSLEILMRALELGNKVNTQLKNINKQSVADTYLALAKISLVMGELSKSLEYNASALRTYIEIQDEVGQIEAYLNLATIQVDVGDVNYGIILAGKSLALAKKNGLNNARQNQVLGNAYATLGAYEKALTYMNKALEDASQTRIQSLILTIRISIGDIYKILGNGDLANQYYSIALTSIEQDTVELQSLESSLNLRLGRLNSARDYFVKENSLRGAGISYLRIGILNLKNDKTDSALNNFKLARDYFFRAGINEGVSNTYLQIGHIYVDLGKNLLAELALDSAMIVTKNPELVWNILYEKGRLYENLNLPDSAIESYQNAIRIIENIRGNISSEEFRSIYLNDRTRVYDRLIRLLMEQGETEESFHYSEKARARLLLDIIGNRRINTGKQNDTSLINREQDLRLKIVYLRKLLQKSSYMLQPDKNEEGNANIVLRTELKEAQNKYEIVLNQLITTDPKYTGLITVNPGKLNDIMSSIDNDMLLLAYWVLDDRIIIWKISNDNIRAKQVLYNRDLLEENIKNCRYYIRTGKSEVSEQSLKMLYQTLIGPFSQELKKYKTIGIITHKSLHFLPFHALIDEEGKYLVEYKNIFYVSSGSIYATGHIKSRADDATFLGMALGANGLEQFSGLPGTSVEIEKIGSFFKHKKLLFGDQMTESYFKKEAPNFDIIHLATHASFNPDNPAYSYILLFPSETEDGELTFNEILGLSLKAQCVTLSACQTALGEITDGDDIIGLSRAFNYAGSPGIIVSLWSVDDESTAVFMTTFYKYWKNCRIYEAISFAQRELIKRYNNPFYWAPFIYIGNGKVSD